jgi:hypothetical protein
MPVPRTVSRSTPKARAEYDRIPRKTKADDPETYTKVPHAYGDVLISGGKLGGQLQRDLVYWIERHTIGNSKRPEYAKLSLTALAKLCQWFDSDAGRLRPAERKSVAVALADLEKRKIIASRDRKGCGPTVAKMYKLTPEHWKTAKPYTPPTRKEIDEAEAAIDAEDQAEEATPPAQPEAESTVANGRLSRPQPVAVRTSRDAAPVTIRLVYNPTGFDSPVTFRARTGANGRVQVTCTPHREGEAKANDCSRTQPQLKKADVDTKRFSDFDLCVNAIALQTWGFALEDGLIRRIMTAAGPAPVALFNRIARKKLETRTAARDHKPGLLVNLAEQACRSHEKEMALEAQRAAERPAAPQPPALTREELEQAAELERRLSQPKPDPCPKCKGTGMGKSVWTSIGGVYAPRPSRCEPCSGTGTLKGGA